MSVLDQGAIERNLLLAILSWRELHCSARRCSTQAEAHRDDFLNVEVDFGWRHSSSPAIAGMDPYAAARNRLAIGELVLLQQNHDAIGA